MSAMSNYLERKLIDATLRGETFATPDVSSLHLALFSADPTDENLTAGEISEDWYARRPTGTWSEPEVDGEGRTASSNENPITFNSVFSTDSTHTIQVTHVGIYDTATDGNLLYHEALTTPRTLEVGDVISFAIGALVLRLD